MRRTQTTVVLLSALALAACARSRVAAEADVWIDNPGDGSVVMEEEEEDDEEEEIEVPLDQVPDDVLAAAVAALPGLVIDHVEVEVGDEPLIYDIEGKVDGVAWEVEVTAAGEVIETERDDEDDD
ncbi:hypothetical protein [Engelhardtia mirabilis]|uniref:PepSY domain-containing protein n=1 Tax=Engelhardtia mirabilis TaxID=2528011 RepID=A0A518BDG7_9BACT|nr:hypothetical protein Pla133_00790 [Planctomycetes bacterium Pla133]QDU99342.1 hypothetical protein Pla86_00790 [Planctomycetes bacterium Pla86]